MLLYHTKDRVAHKRSKMQPHLEHLFPLELGLKTFPKDSRCTSKPDTIELQWSRSSVDRQLSRHLVESMEVRS